MDPIELLGMVQRTFLSELILPRPEKSAASRNLNLISGEETVTLDSKSRFYVPAKFRECIGDNGVRVLIAPKEPTHLWIFSEAEFTNLVLTMRLRSADHSHQANVTDLLHRVESVVPDTEFRILLKSEFVDALKLGVDRMMMISGSGNFLQVNACAPLV